MIPVRLRPFTCVDHTALLGSLWNRILISFISVYPKTIVRQIIIRPYKSYSVPFSESGVSEYCILLHAKNRLKESANMIHIRKPIGQSLAINLGRIVWHHTASWASFLFAQKGDRYLYCVRISKKKDTVSCIFELRFVKRVFRGHCGSLRKSRILLSCTRKQDRNAENPVTMFPVVR